MFGITKIELEETIKASGLNVDAPEFQSSKQPPQGVMDEEQDTDDIQARTEEDEVVTVVETAATTSDNLFSMDGEKNGNSRWDVSTSTQGESSDSDSEDTDDETDRINENIFQDERNMPKIHDSLMEVLKEKVIKQRKKHTVLALNQSETAQGISEESNTRVVHEDIEIRRSGTKVEIDIVHLGNNLQYSEQMEGTSGATKDESALQEFLDPEYLLQLLHKQPNRYRNCKLRISYERQRTVYGEVQDATTRDIVIKNRVRQAFDGDAVVLDLGDHGDPLPAEATTQEASRKNLSLTTGKLVGKFPST